MTLNRRFIVAIGQIPPPTDGLAYITSEYVKLIGEDHDVKVVNISPRTTKRDLGYHISRTATVFLASTHLLFQVWRRNRVCYMPCQGDLGLIYTVYLLGVARLLRYPIYLHHHNFGYINEERRMMHAALRVGGAQVVHIFLCEYMRERFVRTYRKQVRSTVVSNAAFVAPEDEQHPLSSESSLIIGLLSNLNREKGLYIFLDLIRAARTAGLSIRGILAGPLREREDRLALEAAQRELGPLLTYEGPLYGAQKRSFYESIDIFVFPTIYANEAQPTVLFEALSAGNLVVAYARGCITSQVENDGLVIPEDQAFIPAAISWLQKLTLEERAQRRRAIARRTVNIHSTERVRAKMVFALQLNSRNDGPT